MKLMRNYWLDQDLVLSILDDLLRKVNFNTLAQNLKESGIMYIYCFIHDDIIDSVGFISDPHHVYGITENDEIVEYQYTLTGIDISVVGKPFNVSNNNIVRYDPRNIVYIGSVIGVGGIIINLVEKQLRLIGSKINPFMLVRYLIAEFNNRNISI